MNSSYTQHFPTWGDVHHDLTEKIANALSEQLSDNNSPLFQRLHGKVFETPQLLQLAIQDAFYAIWQNGIDKSLDFWFLWTPDKIEKERYQAQRELGDLARNIYEILVPAIIHGAWWVSVDFNNQSVAKILQRLEREKKWSKDAWYLNAWEPNKTEQIALDRLIWGLKQATARLRCEIKASGYPQRVVYDQFTEGKVFKALETTVLSAAFGFMTYGWHWLAYNWLDTLARNARNKGVNGWFAENLLANPYTMNSITWWAWLLAATMIGYWLVRGARKHREYIIKDSELTHATGIPTKVGTWNQRNGLFAASIVVAISGALFEGAWILAHEVQGLYTAKKAHEVWKAIESILDLTNPDSSAWKAYEMYRKAPELIDNQATKWYDAELRRPGASWVWPAAKAKQYLKDGNVVLGDPILARDPNLFSIAQTAEAQLQELSPKSHAQNYTFKLKSEGVKWAYEDATLGLRELAFWKIAYADQEWKKIQTGGLYKSVYEKWTNAKTPDFLAAKDQFELALSQYEASENARNQRWKSITWVYQDFINKTSNAADAKYRSNTAFNAQITFEKPDLTELKKKVAEVPRLEWRDPIEYWHELNDMTGKEGGITEAERAGILALIALRSWVIEALAALFLFLWLRKVRKYYWRTKNLLSEKEKTLVSGHYESLVNSIQNSFSGQNWNGLFPDHEWLTRDEAEYLTRKLIIGVDPTIMEWLPIKLESMSEWWSHVKRIIHNGANVVKDIVTWNTQTNREAYLATLNGILQKLSETAVKDRTWLGIPLEELKKIIEGVLPNEGIVKNIRDTDKKFDTIVSDIAKRLDTLASLSAQTVELHAVEREEHIEQEIEALIDWIDGDLSIFESQINNRIRANGIGGNIQGMSELLKKMSDLRTDVTSKKDPTHSDVMKWKREKDYIIERFKTL